MQVYTKCIPKEQKMTIKIKIYGLSKLFFTFQIYVNGGNGQGC